MDTTPPAATSDPLWTAPPPPSAAAPAFFDGLRETGLVRSEERWIGGVAGGLALRFGVDPLVIRGVLGLAVLLGGLGLIVYGLAWALLPEQRDGRIHLQELLSGRFDVAVIGALAALAGGLSYPDGWQGGLWWGNGWAGDWWPAFLALSALAAVVVLVVSGSRGSAGRGPSTRLPVVPAGRPGGVPGGWQAGTPGGSYPGAWAASAPATPTTASSAPPVASGASPLAPAGAGAAPGTGQPAHPSALPTGPLHPVGPAYGAGAYAGFGGPAGAGGAAGHAGPAGPAGSGGGSGPGGPGWGGTPGGPGYPGGRPYRPGGGSPVGPVTRLPRVRPAGPGAGMVGVVVSLTLLTLAGLMYAARVGTFDGPVLLTAGAVGVVLAGLAIIVSGLRGRTSGALGVLAVLAVLALIPLTAIERSPVPLNGMDVTVGEVVRMPTDVAEAERGYSLGLGETRLDLTELPLTGGTVDVPIRLGAGELRIILPRGADVVADVDLHAGEIDWLGERTSYSGGGSPMTYRTEDTPGASDGSGGRGSSPDIRLDISVGAGTVIVTEAP